MGKDDARPKRFARVGEVLVISSTLDGSRAFVVDSDLKKYADHQAKLLSDVLLPKPHLTRWQRIRGWFEKWKPAPTLLPVWLPLGSRLRISEESRHKIPCEVSETFVCVGRLNSGAGGPCEIIRLPDRRMYHIQQLPEGFAVKVVWLPTTGWVRNGQESVEGALGHQL